MQQRSEVVFEETHYRLVRPLGEGGMGSVYEVEDARSGGRVALKTLREAGPLALYLFKNEFRALADLTHPHLVGLYELGSTGETPWFTMELIDDAVDLAHHFRGAEHSSGLTWLTAQGDLDPDATMPPAMFADLPSIPSEMPEPTPLPDGRLAELRVSLGQLADALETLHAAGRLHRDVKPSNVLVTPEGRAVLVDFGLVATLDGVSRVDPEVIAGSIPYMSPEQSVGAGLGPASDWYSFGAVLYELLTGRPPFAGARAAVLAAKRGREVVPPAEVVPGVPEDLDALCVALLRLEPKDRPTGGHVLAALGRGAVERRQEAPLVGREAQLQSVGQALAQVRGGQAATLHVRGRSGMGKTALVGRALAAIEADALVLTSRCYERDTLPFKAIDPLVDRMTRQLCAMPHARAEALAPRHIRALARLFPVLDRVEAFAEADQRSAPTEDPDEEQRRALGALRELLGRISERQLVVVHIDDLQWSDRDSLAALRELLRPPDPPVMLLILSYRTEALEAEPELASLAKDVPWIEVGPLSGADAGRLAASQLEDPALAARVVAEAGGSPFYTLELARYAARTGNLVDLEAYVARRVEELPESAQSLLRAVALAGAPTRREVLLDCVPEASVAALTALQAGRLVRSEGPGAADRVECDHDRVREAVVAALAPDEATRLHGALAVALIRRDGDAERISDHLLHSGDTKRAAHYARLAADQASAALAFHREAAMLRRLLDLVGQGPERPSLLERYANAIGAAGRANPAAAALLAAVEAGGPKQLEVEAARLFLYSGNLEEGWPLMRKVLGRMGIPVPRQRWRLVAETLLRRLWTRLMPLRIKIRPTAEIPERTLHRLEALVGIGNAAIISDQYIAWYLLARYVQEALRVGDVDHMMVGLADEMFLANAEPGGGARADRAFALAMTLERAASPKARVWTHTLRTVALVQHGRVAEAMASIDTALEHYESAPRLGMERDWVEMFSIAFEAHQRGPGVFVQLEEALVARARARQNIGLELHTRAGCYFNSALIRDDPDLAERQVADMLSRWPGQGDLQCFYCAQTQVRIALYRGDGAGALGLVEANQAMAKGSGAFQSGANRFIWNLLSGLACQLAWLESRDGRLLDRAGACADRCATEGDWGRLGAAQLRGMVQLARGDRAAAEVELKSALENASASRLLAWVVSLEWALAHVREDAAGCAASLERARAFGVTNPERWFMCWVTPLPLALCNPE